MYTRRHSQGRLGNFEGLGVSRTLGNQYLEGLDEFGLGPTRRRRRRGRRRQWRKRRRENRQKRREAETGLSKEDRRAGRKARRTCINACKAQAGFGGFNFGEERQTAAQRGKEVAGGFTQFISAVLPHASDAYKIHQGIPLGPTAPQGGSALAPAQTGNSLPLLIGLGAVGVVLFMVLGKKK